MKCPEEQDLLAFLDGSSDPAKRQEIETHVDDCPICLALIADWAAEQRPGSIVDDESAKDWLTITCGTRLEQFTVLERIGAGAMGSVFAAFDHQLDRKVALKVLRRREAVESEKIAKERLLREAKAMARLSHPNVVTVLGVQEVSEQVVIAMEFVPGMTLRQWLKNKQRSWQEILDVFLQAGQGLACAHSAGLVHRDFKPDNVLIHEDGRALVSDFGLARSVRDRSLPHPAIDSQLSTAVGITALNNDSLTQAGLLVGTPAYIAPEQIAGQKATTQSDQFAFSVALYEALYGERPFVGRSIGELKKKIDVGPNEPSTNARQVPGWLRKILVRGLSAQPEARFPSMNLFLE